MKTLRRSLWLIGFLLYFSNSFGQWNLISNINNQYIYRSVAFVNKDTGFVVGVFIDSTNSNYSPGIILRTQNGGATWDTTRIWDTTYVHVGLYAGYFRSVFAFNKDTVLACGDGGMVVHSFNGGNSWQISNTISASKENLFDIAMLTKSIGFTCTGNGTPAFNKTTDGGITWLKDTSLQGGIAIQMFKNTQTGYVLNGGPRKTIDGGLTWNLFSPNPLNHSLSTFHFLNENIGYVGGLGYNGSPNFNFGTIDKTIDGGITWSSNEIKNIYMINSIYFNNKDTGYVAGGAQSGFDYPIFKTIDGGQTWLSQKVNYNSNYLPFFLDMSVPSLNVGYAVGYGCIYKTSNGGGALGFEEHSNEKGKCIIFPNPSKGTFTLTLNENQSYPINLTITNALGQIIYSERLTSNKTEINLQNQAKGIYFLEAKTNKHTYRNKIAIEQ